MQPMATLPGVLDPAACDRLVALAAAAPARDGGLVGGVTDHNLRRADLVWLDDLPDAAFAMDLLIRAVAQANRSHFGLDLTDFAESAQIARYTADRQGHFGWHSDIGQGTLAARRKLTVVVQLSDPADYDGGALDIWPDAQTRTADTARGSATIFPSFTLHRVTPVTRGTRHSLTLWAHGPAFR
jgi:PKHD-type hydroxylase